MVFDRELLSVTLPGMVAAIGLGELVSFSPNNHFARGQRTFRERPVLQPMLQQLGVQPAWSQTLTSYDHSHCYI